MNVSTAAIALTLIKAKDMHYQYALNAIQSDYYREDSPSEHFIVSVPGRGVMAEYWQSGDGVVHVRDSSGQGEFTFCGYTFEGDKCTADVNGEGDMVSARGPSTCPYCKECVDQIRQALKGVRFKPTTPQQEMRRDICK